MEGEEGRLLSITDLSELRVLEHTLLGPQTLVIEASGALVTAALQLGALRQPRRVIQCNVRELALYGVKHTERADTKRIHVNYNRVCGQRMMMPVITTNMYIYTDMYVMYMYMYVMFVLRSSDDGAAQRRGRRHRVA